MGTRKKWIYTKGVKKSRFSKKVVFEGFFGKVQKKSLFIKGQKNGYNEKNAFLERVKNGGFIKKSLFSKWEEKGGL